MRALFCTWGSQPHAAGDVDVVDGRQAVREVTRQHFGIVLVIIGTILLAFAVKVRSSRGQIDPSAAKVTQFTSSGTASSRRRQRSATIRPWLQWGGLGLLALGSALQW